MNMLLHKNGDLLKMARGGLFDVILHGCNCLCRMGSGIAYQIANEYPKAYEADRQTKAGDTNKLGTYSKYETMDGFTILNGYTQFGIRKYQGEDVFEYKAFENLLQKVIADYPDKRIGLPYIGMGLAGGDSTIIIGQIEKAAKQIAKTGGSITLVKY